MYNMDISILGLKVSVEVLILIGIIYLILIGHTVGGCCKVSTKKEGFTPANTNYGESSNYTLGNNYKRINTYNWGQPSMVVTPGKPLSSAVQKILDREPQPVPLPEGQMLMFATTPFKPECCPNTYSNGSGCACMTTKQYNYLIERGGNNIPFSEY
jgi:hypothetical protein